MLLANLRLTNEDKDFEADLVVLIPDAGICVLEVKGGSIWHDQGGWQEQRRGKTVQILPVDQVRDAKYALRAYVEPDPRWGSRAARGLGTRLGHPALGSSRRLRGPRASPLGPARQGRPGRSRGARERGHPAAQPAQPPPTHDDVELILEILGGRRHTSYDVNAEAADRAAEADGSPRSRR